MTTVDLSNQKPLPRNEGRDLVVETLVVRGDMVYDARILCNATLDSIAAFKLLKKFIKLCHMISFQIIQSLDVRKYKSDLPPDSLLSLSLYLSISVKISVILLCLSVIVMLCASVYVTRFDIFNIYFAYS